MCVVLRVMNCYRCKQDKPDSDFYFNNRTGRHQPHCKVCNNIQSTAWQKANKAKKAQGNKEWRMRNAERVKVIRDANNAMHRAISKGVLIRGVVCCWCGSDSGIEGAHFDYSKPLEVLWLCRSCHRKWDTTDPKS